jgi:NADH:ubiquinone oxidoreductase subunit K
MMLSRIALVLAACLLMASPAYAYLDPGTGSMLVSALIGVAAAVGLALKMFWYRVAGLFRRPKPGARPGAVGGNSAREE